VLGLSLLLSALFVFFRDLGHIWEIVSLVLFYGSAVVFPFARITNQTLRHIAGLNPVLQIVEDIRHSLVDSGNPLIPSMATAVGPLVIVPILGTLVVLAVGFAVFSRLTPKFAEAL
jgi:ABC-2 type transport system permease protein